MDREEILSKVTEWATQMGLTTKNIEDPTADFHIAIYEAKLPPVDIVHPEIDSAYILFAARVSVSEEGQKKMLDLGLEQRENVLWDIRLKLLSLNVDFRMVSPEGGIPTSWEIYSRLFLEGVLAQHFSDHYAKVKNAVLFVIWSYRRILGVSHTN